ncbi:hypothetical protein Ade02nite_47880 [Paractinoplanes deccanensis]|uniref:Lipoprotein n=1 Tax=Paractinoplanes deccanensis TaxID=113561 RepID=A0ABQ3Y833_9ACTN|nr:hypothetical protein [Actinoplanes deccanensis]GID76147.1 hypothetical protein Ade02nite_47880 [Actinoplanes deccanensis]
MRLGWALGGIVLVAAIGGCTSDEPKSSTFVTPSASVVASPPPWKEPASYSYVLARGCDDAAPLGRYRVTIKSGQVASTERLDAQAATPSSTGEVDLGPVTGDQGEEIDAFTLGQLLEMAQTAADDGGEVTRTFSPEGVPVKVMINVSEEGASGAECFGVSEFTPAS